MLIRIDEIPDAGRRLHFHWDKERLQRFLTPDDPYAVGLERPVNVDLEIYKRPDHVRIQGNVNAALRLGCHRCLEAFTYALEQVVDTFLIHESKEGGQEEVELEEQELEYEFFDGEVIDIDQLVAEHIFLALPYKALCSEGCRGICPRCGANLNVEACRCGGEEKPSPFAALAAIKGKLPVKPGP
jgi:uncharacterized protein